MKLSIPFALLFLSATAYTQEILTKAATIAAPEQSSKISFNHYKSFAKEKLKTNAVVNPGSENIYKVGNIIVAFWDLIEHDSYQRTLEQVKSELLSLMTKEYLVDESGIRAINGSKILVFRYHKGKEFNYMFYSEMRKNAGISGMAQFIAADRAKADTIFSKLVNSIKLTNQQ